MSNKNGEDFKSENSFSWMENGKSLSKNLLYTPLVAYKKVLVSAEENFDDGSSTSANTDYHPSHYMMNKSSVPKALQESSLMSILHSISCDYHRNRAGVNDAKNNGSRPLSLSDVEEKIRQRAVTLIGGGVNTSISINKKPLRSKKRRQRSWEEKKDVLEKFASSSEATTESGDVISFLQRLNAAWNEYIWKLLSKDKSFNESQSMAGSSLKEIQGQLVSLTRTVIGTKKKNHSSSGSTRREKEGIACGTFELIGSHIQIKSCNSHRSWIGRFGVVIGETKNTYRIAGFACRKNKKKAKRNKSVTDKVRNIKKTGASGGNVEVETMTVEEHVSDSLQETRNKEPDSAVSEFKASVVEVFLLPKLGSCFQLIIPLPFNQTQQDDPNETKTVGGDDKIAVESMIAIPDEAIGISITDPNEQV
mmetsp:Transcript_18879/g.39698  ORF Transcript_18879/g.39698 Transcript_18879/m.39698 type:complete len:420 (+) Transcript_18879:159-1418(+)